MKAYIIKHPVQNLYLKDFIDGYYEIGWKANDNSDNTLDTGLMPPMGFPVIFFSVGNKIFNHSKHQSVQIGLQGQQTRHFVVPPQKNTQVVGVNFTPFGLYNLLGIAQDKFVNTFSPSSSIFNKNESIELTRLLESVYTVEDGIAILESFLWNQRVKKRKYPILFDDIANRIIDDKGLLDSEYFKTKYCSDRYIQYYFKNNIGFSPKFFSNLQRHKYILKLMFSCPGIKTSELVSEGNYYDLSHFNRDFKLFTNSSPTKYRKSYNHFAEKLILTD